jgi:hypothetical protein
MTTESAGPAKVAGVCVGIDAQPPAPQMQAAAIKRFIIVP